MLPKITELDLNTEEITEDLPNVGKSFLFDFTTGDFVLKDGKLVEVTETEALRMWIQKALKTVKNRFTIYENTQYGLSIEDLIGSIYPESFIYSEFKREITESLLVHPVIQAISQFEIERVKSKLIIRFTVETNSTSFGEELNMSV